MSTGTTTPTTPTPITPTGTKKTLITKLSSGLLAAGLTGWFLVANYWPTPKKPEFPTAVYEVNENCKVYGFEDGRFETHLKIRGSYVNAKDLKKKTIDSILKEEKEWYNSELEKLKSNFQGIRDILNKTD